MQVILVRHCQSEWNAAGRWQGQADPPLTESGIEHARTIARELPRDLIGAVVTSDLQRARATAEPIAARLGVSPVVDAGLRELDVGSWSGLTRAEIEAADPRGLERYRAGERGWSGGETFEELAERSRDAARRLEEAARDAGTVIAVSHGGTIRAIVLALLELPPELRGRLAGVTHGSAVQLQLGVHGWSLAAYNAPASALRL